MKKELQFSDTARQSLQQGINQVAKAVITTMGPRGRNVVIEKSYGTPTITKDGISVAKEITLQNKFENIGASLVKEAASKTNDAAGDGTSNTVLLTQVIFNEGLKLLATGINPIDIRQSLEKRTSEIVANLRKMSQKITDEEKIIQVASVSANDPQIGKIIAKTMNKVGSDGVVTVEEGQSFGVENELVDGMQIDKGYSSPYMVTDNERMKAEFKNPYVLITDQKIASVQEILPLLEKVMKTGNKNLVIIAEEIEGEALATFIVNKLKGAFNVLAIKAPGFGDRKKNTLDDIAVLTGGNVISSDFGKKIETADLNDLGQAYRITAEKDKTIIVDGKGEQENIKIRVESIKNEIDNTEEGLDKEELKKRLAKLTGGVAIIKVGAATETEMKEKKDRVEDALNATRAAIEEGVVPGGGLALAQVGEVFEKNIDKLNFGSQILNNALQEPIKRIINNAGEDGSLILYNIIEKNKKSTKSIGYNVVNKKFEEMLKSGIIDPTKVVRNALENAVSAAIMLLTIEAVIIRQEEDENK